jgi:hypothetical protein
VNVALTTALSAAVVLGLVGGTGVFFWRFQHPTAA